MYYIYSRKSKYTGKGESVENQVEMCKEYLNLNVKGIKDSEIIVYEDEGFSAKNLERPMFKKMMLDSEKQEVKYIVCYRLDRISRNVSDFSSLITDLNNRGISFVSIREQFDTSTPMGRAMMYIASVFAQLERETIAERIRDNMLLLARTGRWLGGTSPTGYKSEKMEQMLVDGKSKQMFKLSVVPEEAKTVKLIFKKFLETNSLTKVETYLIQNNIRTKNNKDFSRFSIKNILENPVYMVADENAYNFFINEGIEFSEGTLTKEKFNGKYGIIAYNKTIQKDGRTNHTRDIKDWVVSIGKHKGLISSSDWIRAHRQLEQNSSKSYRKPKSNVALLSGVLFCGSCGDYMRPKLSKRKNSQGEYVYTYLCQLKEKSRCHNCSMKNPNGNELDKIICEEIKRLSFDYSIFLRGINALRNDIGSKNEGFEEQIEVNSKRIREIDKEISSLLNAISNGGNKTPAYEYIKEKIDKLHSEKVKFIENSEEIETLAKNRGLSRAELNEARESISSFDITFDKMSVTEKRAAIRCLIDKVVWDGENIHLYFYKLEERESKTSSFVGCKTQCEDSK